MIQTRQERLPQLDGMRVVMISIIVLNHMEFLYNYSYGEFYRRFLHNATMAVDYFFLLSGFGIMYGANKILVSKTTIKSCLQFALNKIKNIYPIYIFSMLLMILWRFFYNYGQYSLYYILQSQMKYFVINLTLLQSLSGMTQYSHAICGVCWFLSTLYISYMLCPPIVKLIEQKIINIKSCIFVLTFTICCTLALSFVFSVLETSSSPFKITFDDLVYGSPYIRILYISLGIVICKLYLLCKESSFYNKIKTHINNLFFLILLIALTYFFTRYTLLELIENSIIIRLIDIILCCILLFSLSIGDNTAIKLLSNTTLATIGRNTMYIYLLHYPVRFFVDTTFTKLCINLGNITGIIEVIIIIFITAILSFIIMKIHKLHTKKQEGAYNH